VIDSGYSTCVVWLTAFPDLGQDDQLILIKAGFFEIWLTRMSRMFGKEDGAITFDDGSMISKAELDVIYNVRKLLFGGHELAFSADCILLEMYINSYNLLLIAINYYKLDYMYSFIVLYFMRIYDFLSVFYLVKHSSSSI
jgi:hypothetical protein